MTDGQLWSVWRIAIGILCGFGASQWGMWWQRRQTARLVVAVLGVKEAKKILRLLELPWPAGK